MSGDVPRASLAAPSTALDRLFDERVIGRRCAPGDEALAALLPEERMQVARASQRRRREFAAGRVAARAALSALGAHDVSPLLTGTDRVPLWPDGVVGSISHAQRYCVAVVARDAALAGVGVDVEASRRVTTRVWRHVFTPDEARALEETPEAARDLVATIAFSAKESLFKCQYTVRRGWLGFHDVEVDVARAQWPAAASPDRSGGRHAATTRPVTGALTLELRRDVTAGESGVISFARGTRFACRYTMDEGHVLTGVVLPGGDAGASERIL